MKNTCVGCKHGTPGNNPGSVRCRRYPPSATALLVPAPPTPANPQGGLAVQGTTVWPEIGAHEVCGEFAKAVPLVGLN